MFPSASITDGVQVLFAANKNTPISDGGRSINRFADRIRADNFMLRPGLHDERVAVFAGHQDFSFERDGRSGERGGNRNAPAFVLHLTALSIDARENPAVSRQVEII